ncbi:alpha/beta fold hydrolase [Puia sp. P3]|uniref:alpha/beta fold hydrolase n=1 Tax=Puia sp. P3 TaxID=3423952 RepID=UPI003D66D264
MPEQKKHNYGKRKKRPSIVFCHGIWADGSCWSKLIPTLQEEGYEVIACQYTLQTVAEDVDIVRGSLGRVSSPAILVGHSYGGSVITAAGIDDRVAGLVYIAALWPDSDETSQSQQDKYPKTDIFSNVEVADGRAWMKHSGTQFFAGDLSAEEQQLVWATHFAPNVNLFNTTAHGTAWKTKPSWYIVATDDKTVHPQLQRDGAKKMGASTFEVATSHVPMLSKPEFVLDVIRKAVKGVETAKK